MYSAAPSIDSVIPHYHPRTAWQSESDMMVLNGVVEESVGKGSPPAASPKATYSNILPPDAQNYTSPSQKNKKISTNTITKKDSKKNSNMLVLHETRAMFQVALPPDETPLPFLTKKITVVLAKGLSLLEEKFKYIYKKNRYFFYFVT